MVNGRKITKLIFLVKQDDTPVGVEQVIVLENEQAIKEGIRSVRLDDNVIDWCLVTYTAPKSKTLRYVEMLTSLTLGFMPQGLVAYLK